MNTPLLDYLRPLSSAERAQFLRALAEASGHKVLHVQNVIYGHRRASAALAMQAELLTGGQVRRDLLRHDAVRIWPHQMANTAILTSQGQCKHPVNACAAACACIGAGSQELSTGCMGVNHEADCLLNAGASVSPTQVPPSPSVGGSIVA